MSDRLEVTKTWKLFIGGAFLRTESGRSVAYIDGSGKCVGHLCAASRKDFREAVEAAQSAQPTWADSSGYLRSQILYRLAEMVEGRRNDFVEALRLKGNRGKGAAEREVAATIDRVVCFAGWCDKIDSVMGNRNAVAGPYYNFSVPEPVGVVAVVDGSDAPLLGLASLILPALAVGCAVVAIPNESEPIPALLLAEVCPTADIPKGVFNLLTGSHLELLEVVASHREVDAVVAAVEIKARATLEAGRAENMKRVKCIDPSIDFLGDPSLTSPAVFQSVIDIKTIWHPHST